MRKDKKNHELPEWFNREKYKSLANMSLRDWALNLLIRNEILEHISDCRIYYGEDSTQLKNEILVLYGYEINLIQNIGVLPGDFFQDCTEEMQTSFNAEKSKSELGIVYPMPLIRAVEIHQNVEFDEKLQLDRSYLKHPDFQKLWYGEIINHKNEKLLESSVSIYDLMESDFLETSYDDYFDSGNTGIAHICVELDTTDEIILESFKNWLYSVREKEKNLVGENNNLKKMSNSLITRWINAAILPYIDLRIYQELEGISFTLEEIGEAIFSPTIDKEPADAIRRTTCDLANRALRQSRVILQHTMIMEVRKGKE